MAAKMAADSVCPPEWPYNANPLHDIDELWVI